MVIVRGGAPKTKPSFYFRKMISGAFFLRSSLRRWTVWGFPNPQQFQLSKTKEPGEDVTENPASFWIPQQGFLSVP